ncbi:MAG: hypothetical protein NZ926_00940 [Candidatus Methanomethylicia archaeon]|nr:hypothetical protein [Candidatus Methanomethylicia archaeon]MCX8168998.1 hypothetical protein [Candidatus Methanomethylicia archaeon]MDW7988729.1 hypothetical protein [Nitrososphaerota archaeon]
MNKAGISAVMVSLIILAVSLGMALAYASTMMGWFSSAINIIKIDASESKIILNPSNNNVRLQIVLKNMGTATVKVSVIEIDAEIVGRVNVTFEGQKVKISVDGGKYGQLYKSSNDVLITDNKLLIPQGCIATLYFNITINQPIWKIGATYRAIVFYEGGLTDFKISVIY